MFEHPFLLGVIIGTAFFAGMKVRFLRDSVEPTNSTEDPPEENGYVPAVEEEEFRNFG